MAYSEFVCFDHFGNHFLGGVSWISIQNKSFEFYSAFLNCGQPRKIHKSHKKVNGWPSSTGLQ